MAGAERRPFEQSEHDAAQAEDGERRAAPVDLGRFLDGSRLSFMNRSDSTSTMTASGTFRKNTARQLTCSTSQPPLTGPIAVVIALNPDHVPIARPRSASSNVALMIARLPGTRKAAPMPCSARPTMSVPGDVAIRTESRRP